MLLLHDRLSPLRPIPFYSQRYGRDHKLKYRSEHDLVVDYIEPLNLQDYIGPYDPRQVAVFMKSGYDNKKSQKAIAAKPWHFLIALSELAEIV